MIDVKVGFPRQLVYRDTINERGLKKGFIADKIEVNKALFSQMINGRIYMPVSVEDKLNNFLSL